MRLATYHKEHCGDSVTFVRGKQPGMRDVPWHRIYVSSLFTYELPRTVATVQYYLPAVSNPKDIVVGGIGAILMPEYIRERVSCRVIDGPLDRAGVLDPDARAISSLMPDYSIVDSDKYDFKPKDSYFCRVTTGCIRRCNFCAVPRLEPTFGFLQSVKEQISEVNAQFGERQNLVLLDNNILALGDSLEQVITEIREAGFEAGAVRNGLKRTVDFNQGIDARLIDRDTAKLLSTICLSPIRLAFDHDAVEDDYRQAIGYLAEAGFSAYTNYVMFNYNDSPASFYHRLKVNTELSVKHGIRVTGFPMKYVPIDDVTRRHISSEWRWRYLRGIQCILNATHGMVSPNPVFFEAAFGRSAEEFIEIASMPDRYIINRKQHHDNEAAAWKSLFRSLSPEEHEEFQSALVALNTSRNRRAELAKHRRYRELLEHYYPGGESPHDNQLTLPELEIIPE